MSRATVLQRSASHPTGRPGAILLGGLLLGLGCTSLSAQTLQVTTLQDEFDGVCNSHCSLRDAIQLANSAGTQVRIRLRAGDYRISRISPPDANGYPLDEQHNASGDFDIRGDIIIEGAGREKTRIIGAGADLAVAIPGSPGQYSGRLFDVHPGASLTLTRSQLLLGLALDEGGALKNRGKVLLREVDLHRNGVLVPQGYGQAPEGAWPPGNGGAIVNHGQMEIYHSYLVDNRIDAEEHNQTFGSAVHNSATGQLLLRDSAVVANRSARIHQDFGGPALFNFGSVDIARSWFSHNRSGEDGMFALYNAGEMKLSNSTFFIEQGIRNQQVEMDKPLPNATLIHVTSAGGIFNRARMKVRNSLFAGSPDLFDSQEPDDCSSGGEEAQFQAIGLVTSTPHGCPANAYVEFARVFTRLLFPRDEGNAGNYPTGSLAWAQALGKKGSYLRPRKNGLAVDAGIGSCASHDQLTRVRPRDGNDDGVSICDLGAYEY
jgi:CSLREA domain-containing protein